MTGSGVTGGGVGAADAASPALVPARIVNEHVYCPRLAWLEWEAQAFTDNLDTVEGREHHRAVDRPVGKLPPPPADGQLVDEGVEPFASVTSVRLSSERLGVVAVIDRVESADGAVVPVETKRGVPGPEPGKPLRDPELAQLTAQALLLREHGYRVDHGAVFFAGTRTKHRVELPAEPEPWLAEIVDQVRANANCSTPPEPLVDSPKCPRCSLVSVCLPDESNLLGARAQQRPRRLIAADSPAKPLYVSTPKALVRKRGGRLILEVGGEQLDSRRMLDVSQVALYGNATITAAALRACLDEDVPVLWFTHGGWLVGHAVPHGGAWVQRRVAQYRLADVASVTIPAAMINGKIRNQRTMLRRLGGDRAAAVLPTLKALAVSASEAGSIETLLGIEGAAARSYFSVFDAMLRQQGSAFTFAGRNRRPALDPVNATLSFSYGLLVRDATAALVAAGLDPQVGLLHRPQFGRPSLALDLAEEFRPLVGDSVTITALNNGELREASFVSRGGAVGLSQGGRRALIGTYERRMAQELTHPLFGYSVSYRRALELQARLLAAVVEGQFDEYRPLVTR